MYVHHRTARRHSLKLFDIIALEMERTLICGEEFNVVLNYDLRELTTEGTRTQGRRDMHTLDRAYTHYSYPQSTYLGIVYFFFFS